MNVTVNESKISSDVARLIERTLTPNDQVRTLAYQTFQQLGLPANKAEEYKDTPIARLLEKNFELKSPTREGSIDPSPFLVPDLQANVIAFVNGFFSKEQSRIDEATGVSIISLKQAVEENHPLVLKHLYAYADFKTDGLVAWNTAGWTEGIFIHLHKNHSIDKPLIIHHIQDANNGEVVTVTRNLIVSDPGSKFTIIEKFDSTGDSNHFSNHVTEAVVLENAELNFYSIQNDTGNRYQYNLTQFHQSNYSRVNSFSFSLSHDEASIAAKITSKLCESDKDFVNCWISSRIKSNTSAPDFVRMACCTSSIDV